MLNFMLKNIFFYFKNQIFFQKPNYLYINNKEKLNKKNENSNSS